MTDKISKMIKKCFSHHEKAVRIWHYAQLFVLPFIVFVTEEYFYKAANESSQKAPIIASHILSLIIVCAMFFLFFGILKTSFRAIVALNITVFILMIVNQLKIVYSSNPVFIRDLGFLNSPDTFTDILKENLWGIIKEMLGNVMVMLIVFIIIAYIAYRSNIVLDRKYRLISAGCGLGFLLLMLLPIEPVNNVMIKAFFTIDEKKNNNTVSNMKYYYQHGFFAGVLGEYLTTMLKEPEGYTEERVNALLDSVKDGNGSGDEMGKPNIIMLFSESFFDVTVVDEVQFDTDVAENFHALSEEGMLVNMISPSFGGISCNPEYEMVTSGNIMYFPDNFIPYMNLYTNDEYENTPSIFGELNNNGYSTHVMSCWGKNLFNAANVYDYFGIDETEYITSVDKQYKKGGRISDDFVADTIIEEFENKGEEPLFYMVLTAQNHMPFTETKYSSYDISVTSTEMNDEETGMLLSYAQGVYDADKQLKKLYDYIQTLDEPTMIIFYGDHLPFLKTDSGEDLYEKLGYFNTDDEKLNTYRLYNTQCLILDNYDVEYEEMDYLGYDLVMPYLLNNMDLELSPYYKWIYTTINTMPAANRHVAVDSEGKIYSTADLPDNMQDIYDKRAIINWNVFVDIY